jgi:hypothetical protein
MNDEYIALDCASSVCRETGIEARLRKIKEVKNRKGVNIKMEVNIQTPQPNGNSNEHFPINKESRSIKTSSLAKSHISIFDPNKYMLKLPKTKKVSLPNGQVKWEKTEVDYLPVAARIAWFRKDNPYWSIITEVEQLGNKAVVMKATIKDMLGTVIATARKKETEIGFPDYIEKAETGAIGRALAMCGYGTLQAPEFDEQDRLADSPVAKQNAN